MTTIHLKPAPIPFSGTSLWSSSGRSISSALSPSSTELSVFVTPKEYSTARSVDENGLIRDSAGKERKEEIPKKVNGVFDQDRAVYFGKWANVDPGLNQLYADSHMIFQSAQRLHILSINTTTAIQNSPFPVAPSSSFSFSTNSRQGTPNRTGGDPFTTSTFKSKFVGSVMNNGRKGMVRPGQEATKKYRAICDEYAWRLMEVARNGKLDPSLRSQHAANHQILQLAATLYIPADGVGQGLMGEELLEWYNAYADPEGARELRLMVERIMAREKSWEDDDFAEGVMRSLIRGIPSMTIPLLRQLFDHPQHSISRFAQLLVQSITKMPRSNALKSGHGNRLEYEHEGKFLVAHQEWRVALRDELNVQCRGLEKEGGWLEWDQEVDEDLPDSKAWEEFFMECVDVLLGNEDKILELVDGWKGALGVWGVFVNVGIKRDDLPNVLKTIWAESPADLTSTVEKIETSLLQGQVTKALISCNDFDLWLAAHLTDILDKMLIIEDDPELFPVSLRDYFILSYTETLQAVSQYWDLAVSYLATCGVEGFGRIKALVVRVGLGSSVVEEDDDVDMDGNATTTTKRLKGKGKETNYAQLNEVLKVCYEHKLENEMKEVCRAAAASLLKERQYGTALAYCIQGLDGQVGGDFSQLAAITDAVLDVYISEGAEAFIHAVDSISPSLMKASREEQLNPQPDEHLYPEDSQSTNRDPFLSDILEGLNDGSKERLRFLGNFKDFLVAMEEGEGERAARQVIYMVSRGLVPRRFWAVLLLDSIGLLEDEQVLFSSTDTYELMRLMEEVTTGSTSAPEEYLLLLHRLTSSRREITAPTINGNHSVAKKQDLRFLRSRVEREKIGEKDRQEMRESLRSLNAFKLAALRNLSRAMLDE